MSYLLAFDSHKHECLAVETEGGKALAGLVSYLGLRTLGSGIEIMTVSSLTAYGEYGPYTTLTSEKDFISRVLSLCETEDKTEVWARKSDEYK